MSLLSGIGAKQNNPFDLFSKKKGVETTGAIANQETDKNDKTAMKKKQEPLFNFGANPPETTGELAHKNSFLMVA